ncbi:MAG: hypothetical protein ACYDCL_23625 [Myxococcales bacterium]
MRLSLALLVLLAGGCFTAQFVPDPSVSPQPPSAAVDVYDVGSPVPPQLRRIGLLEYPCLGDGTAHNDMFRGAVVSKALEVGCTGVQLLGEHYGRAANGATCTFQSACLVPK